MLEKIESKEIMTTRNAMEKYRTKYFLMVITDVVDQGDNDLGYVIYAANSIKELAQAPINDYKGMMVGSLLGVAAEPYPSFGSVVHYG
jgi:UDP-glucose 6-dehydrogenase